MARSFFRNVTDQINGSSNVGKTTDVQLQQALTHFEEEHAKLSKFKREFEKYMQALLVFDNASYRFFDFIRSLADSSWTQQQTIAQLCVDIGHIRNEHLQRLNKHTNANINESFSMFDHLKHRIDGRCRLEHDYDKACKQYQASLKRNEQVKVNRIKAELDQLKSALYIANTELRNDLTKFHTNLPNAYVKTLIDLFDVQGHFNKNFHELCFNYITKFKKTPITSDQIENTSLVNETQSTIDDDLRSKSQHGKQFPKLKCTDYKILHEARVIHDYEAENEDEINLVKDEYISVISFYDEESNRCDSGWAYAEKSDGTVGLFPVNFAVRLYENEVKL